MEILESQDERLIKAVGRCNIENDPEGARDTIRLALTVLAQRKSSIRVPGSAHDKGNGKGRSKDNGKGKGKARDSSEDEMY